MGLRSTAMACQRVPNAVCFMLSPVGCNVLSYLDEFMGAFDDYALTGSLLQALGLHKSSHKACPPSTCVTCLGVLFDTINLTMSVTPDRLLELQTDLLPKWLTKKSATKTELQSLIGKLAFVSKCVRPGRLFLTRLLDTLRSLRHTHHRVKLWAECHQYFITKISTTFPVNGVRLHSYLSPLRQSSLCNCHLKSSMRQ